MELDDDHAEELKDRVGIKDKSSSLLPLTTLAAIESLTMPLVQEVVISADIRCKQCQKRVNDFISRMKETESVVVNLSEKKVIVTCKYSGVVKVSSRQIPAVYKKPLGKVALIKRFFGFSGR
ncbi:hypothetical protein Ancab_021040 [Ancistrocladus abbreviatus]